MAINDAAAARTRRHSQVGLALLRNFDSDARRPTGLSSISPAGAVQRPDWAARDRRRRDEATRRVADLLFVAGMWFQDLFNYDFRRTEMCIIPSAPRRANLLLRLQHRGGLAEHHREDAQVANTKEWFAEQGPARDLRRQPPGGESGLKPSCRRLRRGRNGNESEHAPGPANGNGNGDGRVHLAMAGTIQPRPGAPISPERRPGRLRNRLRLPHVALIAPGPAAESRRRLTVECRRCGLPRPRAHAVTLSASDLDVAR